MRLTVSLVEALRQKLLMNECLNNELYIVTWMIHNATEPTTSRHSYKLKSKALD